MTTILIDWVCGSWKTTLLNLINKTNLVLHQSQISVVHDENQFLYWIFNSLNIGVSVLQNIKKEALYFTDINPYIFDVFFHKKITVKKIPNIVFYLKIDEGIREKRINERIWKYDKSLFDTIFFKKILKTLWKKITEILLWSVSWNILFRLKSISGI